jgi:hypothetical protein
MSDWQADLEILAHCYTSFDDLADEMEADVDGAWLRQVWKGRVIVDQKRDGDGVHYKQTPSDEVKEAISEHRDNLRNAHRVAGQTVFRARQRIQKVLHGDPSEKQMEAMHSKLKDMQNDLVWAE